MQAIDLLVKAKWVITGASQNRILNDHAVAIKDGLIHDILPIAVATERYTATSIEHFSSHAVLAGFINGHTHIAMNLFRGLADDLALMNWLNNYIWPAERKWVSAEFVRDGSMLAIAEMIRSGTTCFNDMYFYPDITGEVVDSTGIRAFLGMSILDFPTGWASNADEHFAKSLDFYHAFKHHDRVTPTLAPTGIYAVSDESLMRVKELSEEFDLKINMHVHESVDELNGSMEKTQQRSLKRLQEMGLVSPRLIAVHMCNLNDEDLEIIQIEKPNIVHCPESNMKLGNNNCPVERLRKMGINVALGTDGAASNNDLDMIGEMRTAAFLAKSISQDPTALPATEALNMATLNGAKALGIDHKIGSLVNGKAADFIAVNLDELETMPMFDPISQLVYAASRNQVTDVWVAGKRLMKNRQLLTIDEKEVLAKTRLWAEKIKGC